MADIKTLPIFKNKDLSIIFKNDKDAQKRYIFARAVAEGMAQRTGAKTYSISFPTINKWIQKFEKSGDINCFKEIKRGPKCGSKITEKVIIAVIRISKMNPDWGGDAIYKRVKKEVYVSLRNVYRILKKYNSGEYDDNIKQTSQLDIRECMSYSSYGGSLLLAYYYEKFGIPELFEKIGCSRQEGKLLRYYMHSKLMGIERIDHMYHLNDDGLIMLSGLKERPHQSSIHTALSSLGKFFDQFQIKQMHILQKSYLMKLERIGVDPHFISYYGDHNETGKHWDAIRRMMKHGHRPLYAYDLESGCCFYALWIKEYYKGYRRIDELLDAICGGLIMKNRIKELYIDREFYSFEDLYKIKKCHSIDFTIAARSSKKLNAFIKDIDGRNCGYYTNSRGNTVKVGLLELEPYQFNSDYPLPLTLIGFEEKENKRSPIYGYLSSIPIDRYGPTRLGKLAKKRWRQENYFKESVNQNGLNALPSNEDNQIKGHLALEMLGHNIIQLLKYDLPKDCILKHAELKTIRVKLFQHIAKIVTNPTRITVNFTKDFIEQRNIPCITKKYGRYPIGFLDNRRLSYL